MRKSAFLIAAMGAGVCLPAYAWMDSDSENQPQVQQPLVQPNPEILEVLSRLEQLQTEVQQLRGMVEEQTQTISDLERKQKNMYLDLDSRLQSATPSPAVTAPTTPALPSASAVEGAAVQPQPVVATQAPSPVSTTPATNVSVSAQSGGQGNDKERYQQAYEALRGGQNAMAVQLFESFLVDFPNGQYADNAQYWLAEAYKVNRETDKARTAFLKVINQYPQSAKVPDALLKLGYIEFELQNLPKCREYLTRVTTTYPGTPAANLAAKKLALMP